nr:Chain P, 60S RIBOSOMAL PROTEIN [synthetic construct]
ILMEHIHKL